jgi:hypothetical protein
MAKKATGKSGAKATAGAKSAPKSRAVAKRSSGSGRSRGSSGSRGSNAHSQDMGEAFIKLLQSPLVADLVAVAATAALAALAEQGFTRSGSDRSRGKRAGEAVKAAGKAAAAAIGRRLSNELEEIKQASKNAKGGARA